MRRILYVTFLVLSLIANHRSSAQVNLSSGLVAYYPFNGTFNDASGNSNHGTPRNGASFGTDQWGNSNNAAYFDGFNDFISVAPAASITPGKRFTSAFRFQTNSSALQMIMSKSEYTVPNSFQYQIGINGASVLGNNGLFFATNHVNGCVSTSGFAANYSFGSATNSNQWYCAVITFDSGVKKMYMNGALVSTVTVTGTANNNSIDSCTAGEYRIGSWWQNDPRYFSGLIDEVRLYNRVLNQSEIDSLCNITVLPSIDTIINKYAAVVSHDPCSNTYTVDSTSGFSAGDTVLMIQMKGAIVDTSNSASFGSILSYNGAGNYEYNVIQSVSGNTITLLFQTAKAYDILKGKLQLIRVPSFSNYTINKTHSCLPWNGTKGGVFVIKVNGTLTLNAGINVNGRGFRGGKPQFLNTFTCNKTDYFYPVSSNDGAPKGEGIAEVSLLKGSGRGAMANGGGGGNDHNSGGGGGSLYSQGGRGGNQYNLGSCATNSTIGGVGGYALGSAPFSRNFMGGGGGCGHGNDTAEKAGGNGGGIIIINAATLVGNNHVVSANGDNAPECSGPGAVGGGCINDGGGGGGGGGLIYCTAASITGALNVHTLGGKGSNVYQSPSIPSTGPGGGGSGGAWAFIPSSTNPNVLFSGFGGLAGLSPQWSTNYGAQPGTNGQAFNSSFLVLPTKLFIPNVITTNFNDSASTNCYTRNFVNTTSTTSTGVRTWNWDLGDGSISTLRNPLHTYAAAGTYTVKLVAIDSNGCKDSITKTVGVYCSDTILNRYAAVLSKGLCTNTFTVDTATGFAPGDTILILQMKGATIDSSNSALFGSVVAYNNAGLYEYNVVQSVVGNNITLSYYPKNNYNIPNGRVQFIKTPSFTNYNASRGITCLPWTGSKGGVVAIRVASTLTLNADIDVSGKGFKGGQPRNSNTQPCNKTDYYYSAIGNEGGQKGEGIAELSTILLYGRGAQANGGGGGNAANAGGGGGSGYVTGGRGGNQSVIGACATATTIGGVGGYALSSSPFSRAFLGGGGGAGHGDDTAEKAGGNGGGMIFLNARVIISNNRVLRANGADAPECTGPGAIGGGCANDGGGGGGGGGLIYSTALAVTGNLEVQARGGKGSNVYIIGDPAVGPGGGGSGGAWAFIPGSLSSGVIFSGTGGAAGILPQFAGTAYGAQPGANGQSYASTSMPIASTPFNGNVLNLSFSDSATSCYGRKLINMSTSLSGSPVAYTWFFPAGLTYSQFSPTHTFPGYGSYLLTLTATDSNGCSSSLAKYVDIPYVHFAQGFGDTTICSAKTINISATGGKSYLWTPATGLSTPDAASTLANPAVSTTYTVYVTDSVGCIDSDKVVISIAPTSARVIAMPADSNVCIGNKVQLRASGMISYQWLPTEGLDDANTSNPIATVNGDKMYVVRGIDSAGCISQDTVNLRQLALPEVNATSEGTGSKCEAKPVLLKATGTAQSYRWAPATFVESASSPATNAKPPVTTLYTLFGTGDNGCIAMDTVTAFVNDDAIVMMPDAFTPNGDSRNDIIHPMAFCDFTLDEYHIYDRWGHEVFTSNSSTGGWNGKRGSAQADVGVYHYLIIGKRTSSGTRVTSKGNFMLLR